MPELCPRCGRLHSGVCGIPGNGVGVRVGAGTTGVRRVARRTLVADSYPISVGSGKPKQRARLTRRGLEQLLDWGTEQERRCQEMLKVLSPEMPEYQPLLERLDKVTEANHQVRVQVALKRS